jgi:hypothetical protein
MMYQTTSSYNSDINHTLNNQAANISIQPAIQMSPWLQQMPQQASPVLCSSLSTTQLPMFSPMSLNDYRSRSDTPLSHSPQITSWNGNHQSVPPMTLDNELVYNCNFLGQLQGNYEIETHEGPDQVSVIVPTVVEGQETYAIVRRVCSDGEALPDQLIYQESNRFILCGMSGNVEAVFKRGSNMRHTVIWESAHDGSLNVWRRKGGVTFNLVSVESLALQRRNSISSVGTTSTATSSYAEKPLIEPNGMPMYIRPELLQKNSIHQSRPFLTNSNSSVSHGSNEGFDATLKNNEASTTDAQNDPQEDTMFELIKAHCVSNSSLLKRVVHWGIRNRSRRRVTPDDVNSLSEGRLWVTAHPANFADDDAIEGCSHETLENIKGAYREIRKGVYKQPEPQLNEPGLQHRLMKGPRGLWKIEAHDLDTGKWVMCAKELSDGRWIDLKNNRKVIRVKLIQMSKILHKLGEEFTSENQEIEKSMEFLFTNCNQKKLNSKLKGRNLKHNISNLKVKLEKQYALRFAVEVATTGDSIAKEMDVLG